MSAPTEPPRDPERARQMAWRRAERSRLLAERLAHDPSERREQAHAMAAHLDALLGDVAGRTLAIYWPCRGEPNLSHWMADCHARGARCALPVVAERQAPLVFRPWWPGAPMRRGVWDIPEPDNADAVQPDLVIAPVLGFDAAGWRLGYGGGYYDRTLAVLVPRPLVIGVGPASAQLTGFEPLPHDMPLDGVVTERGWTAGTAAAQAASKRG